MACAASPCKHPKTVDVKHDYLISRQVAKPMYCVCYVRYPFMFEPAESWFSHDSSTRSWCITGRWLVGLSCTGPRPCRSWPFSRLFGDSPRVLWSLGSKTQNGPIQVQKEDWTNDLTWQIIVGRGIKLEDFPGFELGLLCHSVHMTFAAFSVFPQVWSPVWHWRPGLKEYLSTVKTTIQKVDSTFNGFFSLMSLGGPKGRPVLTMAQR